MAAWTLTRLPVGPLQANAYLLAAAQAGEAILIDPGADPEILLHAVQESGCRLVGLLCTHGHFDHVGAAAAIQKQHDLPLLCHPLDADIITAMPRIQAAYGFPATEVPNLSATLQDRTSLSLAGQPIAVRHVPGHSPGHVMFAWDQEALVGDCIFAGSIGRTDLPGGSFVDLARSIREIIYALPDSVRLHSGHGPSTTVGQEKRTNPFVRPLPE